MRVEAVEVRRPARRVLPVGAVVGIEDVREDEQAAVAVKAQLEAVALDAPLPRETVRRLEDRDAALLAGGLELLARLRDPRRPGDEPLRHLVRLGDGAPDPLDGVSEAA